MYTIRHLFSGEYRKYPVCDNYGEMLDVASEYAWDLLIHEHSELTLEPLSNEELLEFINWEIVKITPEQLAVLHNNTELSAWITL